MAEQKYRGQQGFSTSASETNVADFRIMQALMRINTAEPVRVEAVHPGKGRAGTVDVFPLVRLVAGDGSTLAQSTLYELPYLRVQGGKNALVIDPQPGDIGLAIYAMRDAESLKAQPEAVGSGEGVNPGSGRIYDKGDGFYLGGLLNAEPERFVRVADEGITIEGVQKLETHGAHTTLSGEASFTINADSGCTVNAAGGVTINAQAGVTINGDVTINGSISWSGTATGKNDSPARFGNGLVNDAGGIVNNGGLTNDGGLTNSGGSLVSNGITLESHTHQGVQPGSGNTGGPQ